MRVAIIGAGTIGLYLGWKLSQKGEDVFIFEKRDKIGTEVCSGLFSERVLELVPDSRNLVQNQIDSALINFPKKTVRLKFSKRFYVMSHFELDKILYDLAVKAGAIIQLNAEIQEIPTDFERIIGCDGSFSFIRKYLQLSEPIFRLGIQGFVASDAREKFVETWPIESGFIWKIPRGYEIEYGIMANPRSANKIFEEFLNKNKIILKYIRSKIIPQGYVIPDNKEITLCGNAAGLTKPWSGGGVAWGLLAADLLVNSFPDFLNYKKTMDKFFLPKISRSKFLTNFAYFCGFKIPWILPRKFKIESDFLF